MFKAVIHRTYKESSTIGDMVVFNGDKAVFKCCTLELPWKNNQKQASCIPEGNYKVVPRFSDKYKDHYHVIDVPGRDFILFHPANYVKQLKGCIAPGRTHADIDKDGVIDVTSSKDTMLQILNIIQKNEFQLLITKH